MQCIGLSRDYQWGWFVGWLLSVAEGPSDATRSASQLDRAAIFAQHYPGLDVEDSAPVAVNRF